MDKTLARRKTRIGIAMTCSYSLFYGGFVGLSVFRPSWMGGSGLLGLNLATTHGIALIIVAIAFAIIYNMLVRPSVSLEPVDS